ncbi:MAG: class I SAM-dependent methyltransferase [Terriglobales bacterium]
MLKRMRESDLVLKMMVGGFRGLQRVGITVTPNHFYWPVPDMHDLESRAWPADSIPVGFDLNLKKQAKWVADVSGRYQSEWSFPDRPAGPAEYHYNNGLFETVDAEMAYSFVREFKPSRIIEVGGGFSTRILAAALQMNRVSDQIEGDLITIEPFPSPALQGITNLIPERIQDVDLDLFLSLQSGDILFLDSSHVVSVGSDVVREYLEILPRLRPGVIVHVHDIFLPSDYPRDAVLSNFCFWSEQYLLQAFLTFNPHFEVLWASSAMQQLHPEVLLENFPRWDHSYRVMGKEVRQYLPTRDRDRVWPSSFWIRRKS